MSNSRIIDLQNGFSLTITATLPDNAPDDASDDEVDEVCCVECSKTIPTGDKFFTCNYDGGEMEYCSDCFNLDATCTESSCADCSAYREVHAITCDNCGDDLEEDENMGACMCGDKTRICQTCGDWCAKQNEWCCGKELCVVFPDESDDEDSDDDDDDDSDDECEHKCDKCDKDFSSKGKMVVMCVAGKDGEADKFTCYECVEQMTGEIKDKIDELNKFPMTFVPEAEDEDDADDENCAVCHTEILGNAFFCEGNQALMCSDCFDEHPKCSRSQRAKKECEDCERTMEADESDYDSDEYEAEVERRKEMCQQVGEALMAGATEEAAEELERDAKQADATDAYLIMHGKAVLPAGVAIRAAKPQMEDEDDEFTCGDCDKEGVPMKTMCLIDYVLNDDGTFEDGGRYVCWRCSLRFLTKELGRMREEKRANTLVVTDNAPNHETEELD